MTITIFITIPGRISLFKYTTLITQLSFYVAKTKILET